MALILFIVTIWLIGKGLRSLSRVSSTTSRKGKAVQTANNSTLTNKLAALRALQAQRDTINEQLADIETQLDYAPPAKIRNQLMNRKTTLLGKLAVTETKISKLCA